MLLFFGASQIMGETLDVVLGNLGFWTHSRFVNLQHAVVDAEWGQTMQHDPPTLGTVFRQEIFVVPKNTTDYT